MTATVTGEAPGGPSAPSPNPRLALAQALIVQAAASRDPAPLLEAAGALLREAAEAAGRPALRPSGEDAPTAPSTPATAAPPTLRRLGGA